MKSTKVMAIKNENSKAKELLDKYFIVVILMVMVIIVSIISPKFLKVTVILNMIRQVSLIGILSLGMMLVIINGGVDLSAGSQIGMTSVVCAIFAQPEGMLVGAFIMPIIAGLVCGFVNGFLITVPKIPPFIATLGMMNIAKGVGLLFSDGMPISNIRPEIVWIGSENILGIPVLILIFLACAIVIHIMLQFTRFGKKVYALGGNEQASKVCGINVTKTRITVYMINSLMAAIAGILITGRVTSGAVSNGEQYHLDAIAAAVIGGVSMKGGFGSVFGVVIGVLIVGVLQTALDLNGVSPYWQQICKGGIIIVAVVIDNLRNNNKR